MRIFMTGATGWIGSATVRELITAGHSVDGLTRSDTSAQRLTELGGSPVQGALDSLEVIRAAAAQADAVVHLGNQHDFQDPAGTNRTERAVIDAVLDVLAGTDKPLVVASVLTGVAPGRMATERDPSPFHGEDSLRGGSENQALQAVERGVRSIAIRFAPTVHGQHDPGLLAQLVGIARAQQLSGFVDDGANRWAAVHISDAAALVRLAVEHAPAGSVLHAVAEQGVPTREIADAIAHGLKVPSASVPAAEAAAHFGWLGAFFGMDLRADSAATRELVGWRPNGPLLLDDLTTDAYFHL